MSTPPQDPRTRTKQFALAVIRLCGALPRSQTTFVISNQLLRSGTSVGAHYREATRARSTAEFVSKIEGGQQELEESMYWLELLVESGITRDERVNSLHKEANEIMAILASLARGAKRSGSEKVVPLRSRSTDSRKEPQ